jgi:uncharacterized cupredoxin-like copper-binding protein
MKNLRRFGLAALSFLFVSHVWAHSNSMHMPAASQVRMEQKPWGIAGLSKDVVRTVEIKMTDNMRFTPSLIEVKQGETIKLVHRNAGKVMHEFVLGTAADLAEHAALMKKFPDMEHDEPYMAHVEPSKRGQIIWNFNRPGDFEFACLLPGHFEAGMIGKVRVLPK